MKQRKLKIWNGRWFQKGQGSIFVAAYSVADAISMVEEMNGYQTRSMASEIRAYWSKGCWGKQMDGITPERGIWIAKDHYSKPERRFPIEGSTDERTSSMA